MFGSPDLLRRHNSKVTRHISSNLLLSTVIVGTSVFSYGFDTGVLDTVQAMTPFEKRFGEYNPKTKQYFINSTNLAFLNSFPLILFAIGVIVASQVGERWGRRAVLILTNLVCLTGTAICYTAKEYGQILAGRMIINMHVGIEGWLVPMYQAEIVPASIRGAMVTLYAFNHIFAAFISSIITNATSKYTDDNAWRIPVACMFIFPILVLLGSPFVPESPRWLMRKGRFEDAVECLDYLNNHNKEYVAVEEATLLQDALSEGVTKGKWSDLFKGVNRRRTLIGIAAAAFKMLTGQSFASQYGAIFIKSINVMDPFQATMIKRAILILGPLSVMLLVDRLGRRVMFLTFASLSAAALLVMGGLGTMSSAQTDMSVKKGIVAMAMFFPFTYMVSFGATLVVVESEVPHITLRDKSTMIFWSVSNVCNFVATFTLPYLLNAPYANLHSKVGFIYGSISAVGVIWGFLFMPETMGKSLEEVDEMFEAKVPAWRSRGWHSTAVGARLTAIENDPHAVYLEEKTAGETRVEVVKT